MVNRRRAILLSAVVLSITLLFGLAIFRESFKPLARSQDPSQFSPQNPSEESASAEGTEDDEQEPTSVATGFEFDSEVILGEPIKVGSFEGRPGEIVFTTLTPDFLDPEDPEAGFLVKVEMKGIDLSGEETLLITGDQSNEIEIGPKAIVTRVNFMNEGDYRLDLIPKLTSNGRGMRLNAIGSFIHRSAEN